MAVSLQSSENIVFSIKKSLYEKQLGPPFKFPGQEIMFEFSFLKDHPSEIRENICWERKTINKWCWKEKKCHQQTRNKSSRKTESRWDQTREHTRAKEASFPDTIIRYSSCLGCPRKYPTLELTTTTTKKRVTMGKRAVSKVMPKILYLTCQKLSPSPFALHQGREQAQLRTGSTRTNERMLASEKEGSGKWNVSGVLQQTQSWRTLLRSKIVQVLHIPI